MDVHEVYSFQSQVLSAGLELLRQVSGVHAVDAGRHVLLADDLRVDHLLHESGSRDPLVRVVWDVSDLGAHEKLVSLLPILPDQRLESGANRALAFLAPVIDGRVKHVDAA